MLLSFEADKAVADYFKSVFSMSYQVSIFMSFCTYFDVIFEADKNVVDYLLQVSLFKVSFISESSE